MMKLLSAAIFFVYFVMVSINLSYCGELEVRLFQAMEDHEELGVISKIVNEGASLFNPLGDNGLPVVYQAILLEEIEYVKYFVKDKKMDINLAFIFPDSKAREGKTPLQYAEEIGNQEIIEFLKEYKSPHLIPQDEDIHVCIHDQIVRKAPPPIVVEQKYN